MEDRLDPVFRALADPTRRAVLDALRERNGQTLTELCGYADMARQSVTQHLGILEAANLVSTVRRGREKLHYLNPVPLQEIQERWIERFEGPRLRVLSELKRRAEDRAMTDEPEFVYVTYINATAEQVWDALTDADLTGAYWGHRNVSTWDPGAPWEHVRTDGSGVADVAGTVLEARPPERLVMTFGPPGHEAPTRVAFTITPHEDIVRLTVVHEGFTSDADRELASVGWPAVLANLKSLLETGRVLPQPPWEMHAELRAQQTAANDPR